MRKREPHPLTFRHNTDKKYCQKLLSYIKETITTTTPHPPKGRHGKSHDDGAKQTNSSTMTHC